MQLLSKRLDASPCPLRELVCNSLQPLLAHPDLILLLRLQSLQRALHSRHLVHRNALRRLLTQNLELSMHLGPPLLLT